MESADRSWKIKELVYDIKVAASKQNGDDQIRGVRDGFTEQGGWA